MKSNGYAKHIRCTSGANIVMGFWLIAAPWIYGYVDGGGPGTWNNLIAGAMLSVFAYLRYRAPDSASTLSWINLLLGIWVALSPWMYGYTGDLARTFNNVTLGILIAAFALWSGSATVAWHRHHSG